MVISATQLTFGRELFEGEGFEIDGLTYIVISEENHEVEVSGSSDLAGDLIIPNEVTTGSTHYFVTRIAYRAFRKCSNLKSVIIPNSVTSMGEYAFQECTELLSVTLSTSLSVIPASAFRSCQSITSIIIPDSVKTIEEYAFSGCRALASINIPNSVMTIGKSAFSNCRALVSVELPDSLTTIEQFIFGACFNLSSITFPNSITTIGDEAFFQCALKSLTLPNTVTTIGKSAFSGCAIESLNIPNSVTHIGEQAFEGCRNLTSVIIPSFVTFIGIDAFGSCDSLIEILVEDGNECYLSAEGILYNNDKSSLLQYPAGKSGDFIIPNTVSALGDYAFHGCNKITSLEIPSSVKTIGNSAFYDAGLTSLNIPNTVTEIGCNAFYGSHLTSLIIPNSVTSITSYTFSRCTKLTSIVIPTKVSNIEDCAFYESNNLYKIVSANPEPQTCGEYPFYGVPASAVVYVPKNSSEAYSLADGWNYFNDFREMGAVKIILNMKIEELNVGSSEFCEAIIEKDPDVYVQSEQWSSSDSKVATIDAEGKVTAIAEGTTTITFTIIDCYGISHTASCVVSVVEGSSVEEIVDKGILDFDFNTSYEVFTHQGVRVTDRISDVAPGLYIIRQGKEVMKIVIK